MDRDEVIAFIALYSNGRFEEAVNSCFNEDAC